MIDNDEMKAGNLVRFRNDWENEKVLLIIKCEPRENWFSFMKRKNVMAVIGTDFDGKEWGVIVNKEMRAGNYASCDERITLCERYDDGRWSDDYDDTFCVPDEPDFVRVRL